jgi:catechol 2,3-dioxygenase-like lactoylglutathione lyase family enzyme
VITGAHAIIYTSDPEGLRAFFRDVLGFPHVDSGGGWLIFKLPPAEVAVHPIEGAGHHELYLMCDDLASTVAEIRSKGVEVRETSDQGWGLLASIAIPGGGQLGLYQPRHPLAIDLP